MQANTGHSQNNQGGQQGNQSAKPSLSWSQPAASQVHGTTTIVPPVVITTSQNHMTKMAQEKSHTSTYVAIFVGGIIVGALIGWAITNSRNANSTATSTATSTTETSIDTTSTPEVTQITDTAQSSDFFTVVSPQVAGYAVEVSNVKISQPTWVVVYEDRAGARGNALGAVLFLPQAQGTAQSGTVELLRATMAGQNYFVGEVVDNGDKTFSLKNDVPVSDAQGNPILTQFVAK